MGISAREAAELAGMSKQGIIRAIHAGRLSATRDNKGAFVIDPVELQRVFPQAPTSVNSDTKVDNQPTTHQAELLSQRVELLERMLRDKDDTIMDLRVRLDRAEDERTRTQLLLEDKQKPRPNWWQRLLGR